MTVFVRNMFLSTCICAQFTTRKNQIGNKTALNKSDIKKVIAFPGACLSVARAIAVTRGFQRCRHRRDQPCGKSGLCHRYGVADVLGASENRLAQRRLRAGDRVSRGHY